MSLQVVKTFSPYISFTIPKGDIVYIVEVDTASHSLSRKLQKKLIDQGYPCRITNGKNVPPDICWLIIVDLNNNTVWQQQRQIFQIAHNVSLALKENKGMFIVIENLGGSYGIDNMTGCGWNGGYSGLLKTLSLEWPQAYVKCIDIEPEQPQIDKAIVEEIFRGGREREVSLNKKGRYIPILRPASSKPLQSSLRGGDICLVSGGARGVTAFCLRKILRKYPLRIAILGRTKIEKESEETIHWKSEKELNRGLVKLSYARGENISLVELKAKVQSILHCREALENISQMRKSGEVIYFQVDIGDSNAVKKVIGQIHEKWGGVNAIIHAAGVKDDKRIEKKTVAQMQAVFTPKIEGFYNLLQYLNKDPLKVICCFSSIAARMGNIGQSDYAMANETLNKVCQALHHQLTIPIYAINWGPWAGGMVTKELQKHFGQRDIPLLSLEKGAEKFVEVIENRFSGVELTIAQNAEKWSQKPQQDTYFWTFSPPQLKLVEDHKILGKAIVPVVLIHEMGLRLVKSLLPQQDIYNSKNFTVLKGIEAKECYNKEFIWKVDIDFASCDLLLLDHLSRPRYRWQVEFATDKVRSSPIVEKSKTLTWNYTTTEIYKKLFHRGAFQVIAELLDTTPESCKARLQLSKEKGEIPGLTPITLIDGGLQLLLLHVLHHQKCMTLPISWENFYFFSPWQHQLEAQVHCIDNTTPISTWQVEFINLDRQIVAKIENLKCCAVN